MSGLNRILFSDLTLNTYVIGGMQVYFGWSPNFALPVVELWVSPQNQLGVINWIRVNERFRGCGLARWIIDRAEPDFRALATAHIRDEAKGMKPWFEFSELLGLYVLKRQRPHREKAA